MQNQSIETLRNYVKGLWEKKLGYSITNYNENFFILGGNSIQAMEMIGEMNHKFDLDITIADFFEALEIDNLALLLQQRSAQLSATTSA